MLIANVGCANGERKVDEGKDGFPNINYIRRDNGDDEVEPDVGPDGPVAMEAEKWQCGFKSQQKTTPHG